MDEDLEDILAALTQRRARQKDVVAPPPLYLDPQAVWHVFRELTGLNQPPKAQGAATDDPPPLPSLYEAMRPILERKVPRVESRAEVDANVHRFVRVKGRLRAARFPDGGLNLELAFGDIRGLLFHTPEYFNSLIRPLLGDDRLLRLEQEASALAYVHGPVEDLIFYHQTYGDNQEHQWAPLAPAVIQAVTEK
jgi:hypothetical protein